jgi:hypothetical protein
MSSFNKGFLVGVAIISAEWIIAVFIVSLLE